MRSIFVIILIFIQSNIFAQISDFSLQTTHTDEICAGNGTINMSVSNITEGALLTYYLFKAPNFTTPLMQTTESIFSGLTGGTYKVVATQSLNGESKSEENQINIAPLFIELNYSLSSEIVYGCTNYGVITVEIISGNPSYYEIISGPIIVGAQASNVFTNLVSGIYNIRVFDQCNNALVTTYVLNFNLSNIELSEGHQLIVDANCQNANLTNFLIADEGSTLHYPVQASLKIYPPDGTAPIIINSIYPNGDSLTLDISYYILLYGDETFVYDLVVTDDCGFTYQKNQTTIDPNPIVTANSQEMDCGLFFVTFLSTVNSYPYTLNFTEFPEDFNPNNYNIDYPGPYTNDIQVFGNEEMVFPFGTYTIEITDNCGRKSEHTFDLEENKPDPTITAVNNGCGSLFGSINISLPDNRELVFVEIITAPEEYQPTLPHNISSFISAIGKLHIINMPIGEYTIVFIDNCGTEYEETVEVPEFVLSSMKGETKPDCDSISGSIKLTSGNGKLVSVSIVSAPDAFNQTLPFDISQYINNSGVLMMNSLPEGLYEFSGVDICGFALTGFTLDVKGYVSNADVDLIRQCNSFSLMVQDITIGDVTAQQYWLQQYNTAQNKWMHPLTEQLYTEGDVITGETGVEMFAYIALNNLPYKGLFRVIKTFQSFNNVSGTITCFDIVYEFEYTGDLKILGAYTLDCIGGSGGQDIILDSLGIPPYSYSIIKKNDLPYIVENGLNNIFTITDPGIYTFQVEDSCGSIDTRTFDLSGLLPLAKAFQANSMLVCVEEGIEVSTFDFTTQNAQTLGNQDPNYYTVQYFLNDADAHNNENSIGNSYTNITNPQTIYTRVTHKSLDVCYDINSFNIFVGNNPILTGDHEKIVCVGSSVRLDADFGDFTYLWSTGETTRSIIVTQPGIYHVVVSNVYDDFSCDSTQSFEVTQSSIATIEMIITEDWTNNSNYFIVEVSGLGDYEYSLDNIVYQDENKFENLTPGEYTVYVRDKNGCGVENEDLFLLNYPKFFTPNGDGYNDYWKINLSGLEPNMKIYIFDRYGKFIKYLSANDSGWDGTLNGRKLPSTDYWFKVIRQSKEIHRGHFTLKR